MIRLALSSLLLVALACGDDDRPGTDAAPDAVEPTDARVVEDGGETDGAGDNGESDAAQDEDTGVLDAAADMGVPSVDAGPDGNVDAGSDAPAEFDAGAFRVSPTQCVTSAECGGGTCEPTSPGGICNGCGAAAGSCPGATMCGAFGACAQPCDDDLECNAGMRCARSRCVLRRCSDAEMCAPYACTDGFCRRPTCDDGSCPAPFTCESGLCVEP